MAETGPSSSAAAQPAEREAAQPDASSQVDEVLSLLDLDYKCTLAAERKRAAEKKAEAEAAANALAPDEIEEATEAAVAEGYGQLGDTAFSDDEDEDEDMDNGYEALGEDGDDGEEGGGGVCCDEAAAPEAAAPAPMAAAAAAADTEEWTAEFPAMDGSESAASSSAPPPLPAPSQPLGPAHVDTIKQVMAGLSLAPPPPKWASTVPESVWMDAILRRTPNDGDGRGGGATRASAQPKVAGRGRGGDQSRGGSRRGGSEPYVPDIS